MTTALGSKLDQRARTRSGSFNNASTEELRDEPEGIRPGSALYHSAPSPGYRGYSGAPIVPNYQAPAPPKPTSVPKKAPDGSTLTKSDPSGLLQSTGKADLSDIVPLSPEASAGHKTRRLRMRYYQSLRLLPRGSGSPNQPQRQRLGGGMPHSITSPPPNTLLGQAQAQRYNTSPASVRNYDIDRNRSMGPAQPIPHSYPSALPNPSMMTKRAPPQTTGSMPQHEQALAPPDYGFSPGRPSPTKRRSDPNMRSAALPMQQRQKPDWDFKSDERPETYVCTADVRVTLSRSKSPYQTNSSVQTTTLKTGTKVKVSAIKNGIITVVEPMRGRCQLFTADGRQQLQKLTTVQTTIIPPESSPILSSVKSSDGSDDIFELEL